MVRLLNQRGELARQQAKLLQAAGQPPFVLGQEEETIARAVNPAAVRWRARSVRAVFRELVSGCRWLVREVKVAFLGPLYSFSHLAAMHRFGQSVELAPVGSIAAVFEEVSRGHCQFGLVPLENSTDGRVADTLDMFTRMPLHVCGEVELEIHHTLLGKCPRSEVQEVYSKPQALSQCRNWLAKHLPAARPIEVTSTSTAAQLANEKPGAAAIASIQAGIHYGLNVLAENIEDNPGNTTRFAVIGDQPAARTGHDKIALMFQVRASARRPGRRDQHLQAEPAEHDLDRVVSHPRREGGVHVLRRTRRARDRRPGPPGTLLLAAADAPAGGPRLVSRGERSGQRARSA